ncbi:MAG: gliding motility protein GldL, partial [Muribaculaceae bacterium]|nr:gliding motility protein GldL [Muribaculaceae bacterium]
AEPAAEGRDAVAATGAVHPYVGHVVAGNGGAGAVTAQDVAAVPAEGRKTYSANEQYIGATPELASEMARLMETTRELNKVHDTLLESYRAITENANNITGNSNGYVEQMQTLNQNIAALNTIYGIQLKSISGQLDSIDRVNRGISEIRDMFENSARQSARYCEEAEKMASNMQQLNKVYERMITAMTINMYHPGMVNGSVDNVSSVPRANAGADVVNNNNVQ